LHDYEAIGDCTDGDCSYDFNIVTCEFGCTLQSGDDVCADDPCTDVVCDSPPDDECEDTDTLNAYDPEGYCVDGDCYYNFVPTDCPFGCVSQAGDDVCEADPCDGVVCDDPPNDECTDSVHLLVYEDTGSCDGGLCSYIAAENLCPHGCDTKPGDDDCVPAGDCYIGDFVVEDLSDVTVLDTYTCVVGNLTFTTVVLVSLPNLISVSGSLTIESSAFSSPQHMSLPALMYVGEDMTIGSTNSLETLDVSSLAMVGGQLYVHENVILTDLSAFSNLSTLGGSLNIFDNDALTSIAGLSGLSGVIEGYISIHWNDLLTNLSGLEGIQSTTGWMYLVDNDSLVNVDGLSNLATVGDWLTLQALPSLENLYGLGSLSYVGGDFSLYLSAAAILPNLSGLENLTEVGGDLDLSGVSQPTSLTGLNSLATVGGDVGISLDGIANLEGLNGLVSTAGSFVISNCDNLSLVSGLDSLETVSGGLSIYNNDSLVNLDGFEAIETVGGDLSVYDNPVLPYCEICDLLNVLLSGPSTVIASGNSNDSCWVLSTLTCP
jgi:hypothetical protein